jgi:Cu+-exporting ATPase
MVVDAILHGSTPKEGMVAIEIDPVCGMEVDTSTSLLSFEYEGRTYWFCGRGCLLDFKDDPASFLSAEDPQPA